MAKIGEGIHLAAVAGERVKVSDEDDEGFFEFNVVLAFAQHVEIYHGLLAIETKGDDRDNSDSRRKLELGKAWEGSAGGQYGYFMVFDKKPMEGAYAFEDFMDMVRDV